MGGIGEDEEGDPRGYMYAYCHQANLTYMQSTS